MNLSSSTFNSNPSIHPIMSFWGNQQTDTGKCEPWALSTRQMQLQVGAEAHKICAQLCPTLRPRGPQPTRLLCLRDFPGQNAEWVAVPFSRVSSRPRDRTLISDISWIDRWVLYLRAIGKTDGAVLKIKTAVRVRELMVNMWRLLFLHWAYCDPVCMTVCVWEWG